MLGINPLSIVPKPPPFLPWKDPRCLALWDAAAPQTIVSGRVTAAPSLVNSAHILAPPATFVGPTKDTSIGGQPTWVSDGSTVILQCPTFPFPAVSVSPVSKIWFYVVMRGDAQIGGGTGSNTMIAGGPGLIPSTLLGYYPGTGGIIASLSANISLLQASGSPPGNYVQGVPKRMVQFHSGLPSVDFIRWGSLTVTGTTSGVAAQSGFTLFARGDKTALAAGAIALIGLFTGDPAVGNLYSKLETYMAARWGSSPWAALT